MNFLKRIFIFIFTVTYLMIVGSSLITAQPPSNFTIYLPYIEPAYIPPETLDIIYSGENNGNLDLFLIRADGTDLRQVTDHSSNEIEPAASYDGNRFIFVSDRHGNNEIFSLDRNTQAVVQRTDHPADDRSPKYSPNGEHISFISNRDSMTNTYHLYVANDDGSNPIRVSDSVTTSVSSGYGWSPDSTRLAFAESYNSTYIYVVNRDGTDPYVISPDLSMYASPRVNHVQWTGTGEQLLVAGFCQPIVPSTPCRFAMKIAADGSSNQGQHIQSCGIFITAFNHPYHICPESTSVSGESFGYFSIWNSRTNSRTLEYGGNFTYKYFDPVWVELFENE